MSFVTRLTLQSGDRATLDDVVADIKEAAQRKGARMKGPHARPPSELRVPMYKNADAGESFSAWSYTVYSREVEVVGHDEFAREVAGRSFPDGVHVSVEVDQQHPAGTN